MKGKKGIIALFLSGILHQITEEKHQFIMLNFNIQLSVLAQPLMNIET